MNDSKQSQFYLNSANQDDARWLDECSDISVFHFFSVPLWRMQFPACRRRRDHILDILDSKRLTTGWDNSPADWVCVLWIYCPLYCDLWRTEWLNVVNEYVYYPVTFCYAAWLTVDQVVLVPSQIAKGTDMGIPSLCKYNMQLFTDLGFPFCNQLK